MGPYFLLIFIYLVIFLLSLQIVFLDSLDSCSSVLFYCSSRKTWVLVTVKRDVKVGQFTLKIQLDFFFVYTNSLVNATFGFSKTLC